MKRNTAVLEANGEGPGLGGESGQRFVGLLVVVLIATGAMYARTGGYEFTNWDEPTVLLDRERVRSLSNLGAIWTEPHMMDFFPMTETSYALEYSLAGYNPRVYHVTNVVLHLACTGVVCWLGWTLGLGAVGSAVAGAVFGLHPMHVETVAWVADRKDLLACLFSVLSILAFVAHHRRSSKLWYLLAVLLGVGAMLSKPSAASLGACVVVLQVAVLGVGIRRGLLRAGPLLAAGLGLSVLIFWMHEAGGNIQSESYTDPGQSVLLSLYGFGFHLWKFCWPDPLVPLYEVGELTWNEWAIWSSGAILVAFVAAMWGCRHQALVILALGWYAVGIAPVLRFVQVGSMVVADRYMYFPSVGFCLLLGLAVAGGRGDRSRTGKRVRGQWFVGGAAGVVICLMAGVTHSQIGQWRDSEVLWRHTIRVQPIGEAYTNLGTALSDQKRYAEAIEVFRQALALDGEKADWHTNLGNALVHVEHYEEAITAYGKALRLSPGHYKARVNLCHALLYEHLYAQALAVVMRGFAHSPDEPSLLNMAAWILATCPAEDLRNGKEAIRLARRASELEGGKDASTLDTLAAGMAEAGDFQGALEQSRRAIEMAEAMGDEALVKEIRERLVLYEAGRAYRSRD